MPKKGNQGYHDRVAGKYDQIYDSPYWRFYRDISWRHLQGFLPSGRPAWTLAPQLAYEHSVAAYLGRGGEGAA